MTGRTTLADVAILDCTFRDGGYYTSWDFSDQTAAAYLQAMSRLPVDTVELGYCNLPKNRYFGRFYYLSHGTTAWAREMLAPNQRLAVMFDEKAVEPRDVSRLLRPLGDSIDIVRIAVAPTRLAHAAELATEVRAMGLDVGINIMYLSKYWDRVQDLDSLEPVSELSYAVSLVDSYGSVTPEQTARAVSDTKNLLPDATVGFHGHDNLGLAVANSLSAAAAGASIVDGTVTGIGRGPGNSKLETLMVLKSAHSPGTLDFVALHAGMEPLEKLQHDYGWGTNLAYMISGAAGLPQNEVMDWLGKNRYSVPTIVNALQGNHGGQLDVAEHPAFDSDAPQADEVVIIGGGRAALDHSSAVVAYADQTGATVIHANLRHPSLIGEFASKEFLCLAGDAAGRLPAPSTLQQLEALLVPTAPRFQGAPKMSDVAVREVRGYAAADGNLGPVDDVGPLSIALGTAVAMGAKRIVLVGFDGYTNASASQQDLASEIQTMIDRFMHEFSEIELVSGTNTRYSLQGDSLYAHLSGAVFQRR